MPRTPPVTGLKETIIQNPGLMVSQLTSRLGTTYSSLQPLLVRAEAHGFLLTEAPKQPAVIYFFRDLIEIDTTHGD
jgi:hypothetical protein